MLRSLHKDILTIIWRLIHRERLKLINNEYITIFANCFGDKSYYYNIYGPSFSKILHDVPLSESIAANYRGLENGKWKCAVAMGVYKMRHKLTASDLHDAFYLLPYENNRYIVAELPKNY
jgi:hypothetical protein